MLTGPPHPSPPALSQPPEPVAALEDLARALVHEGQHLILHSGSRVALDRANRSLQTCWQALAPQAVVLHFSARQPWTWLGHLNDQVRRHLPHIAQAAAPDLAHHRPEEIVVLHQAEQLKPSDMALLQGLTQHLPGWQVRWVLLCEQPSTTAWGAAASHRWLSWRLSDDADASPAPTHLATANSPLHTLENTGESTAQASATNDAAANVAMNAASNAALNAALNAASSPAPPPAGRWAQSLGWVVLVLVLSVGAWLIASGRITLSGLPAASQTAPTPTATLRTAPGETAPPRPAAAPADTAAASETSDPDQAAVATHTAPPPVPDVAMRGARWLARQSPEHFVLEHGIFDSADQAQSLIRSRTELSNALIVMHKPGQAHAGRFGVITGPFRSSERAQNYKVRENLPLQIPVRSVASVLQDIVTPPEASGKAP